MDEASSYIVEVVILAKSQGYWFASFISSGISYLQEAI